MEMETGDRADVRLIFIERGRVTITRLTMRRAGMRPRFRHYRGPESFSFKGAF